MKTFLCIATIIASSAFVSHANPVSPQPEGLIVAHPSAQENSALHQVNLDKRNLILAAATGAVSVATSIGGFIVGKKSNERREKIDIEKAKRDEQIRKDLEQTRKSVEKQQNQLEKEQQDMKKRQEKLEQKQQKLNEKQNELDTPDTDKKRNYIVERNPKTDLSNEDLYDSENILQMSTRSNRIRNMHSGQYKSRVQPSYDEFY